MAMQRGNSALVLGILGHDSLTDIFKFYSSYYYYNNYYLL